MSIYHLDMLGPRRITKRVIATPILLALLLLTACSTGFARNAETEPDAATESPSAATDPVKACRLLIALPRGLAQQRAAELGCVEVGDDDWEYRGAASASPAPATVPKPESQPGGGIPWREAVYHVGTTQRVCGPLVGSGNSGDDVFLDLGYNYPDPRRFQIVVWDVGGLEPIDYGSTLCTSGVITLYQGVAQIELHDPSAIEIYR